MLMKLIWGVSSHQIHNENTHSRNLYRTHIPVVIETRLFNGSDFSLLASWMMDRPVPSFVAWIFHSRIKSENMFLFLRWKRARATEQKCRVLIFRSLNGSGMRWEPQCVYFTIWQYTDVVSAARQEKKKRNIRIDAEQHICAIKFDALSIFLSVQHTRLFRDAFFFWSSANQITRQLLIMNAIGTVAEDKIKMNHFAIMQKRGSLRCSRDTAKGIIMTPERLFSCCLEKMHICANKICVLASTRENNYH